MRYIRNDRIISGRLQEELVMLDVEAGKYFGLNEVAARIWELLEKPAGMDELVKILTAEYDISGEACRADVDRYLGEMLKLGLVKRTD